MGTYIKYSLIVIFIAIVIIIEKLLQFRKWTCFRNIRTYLFWKSGDNAQLLQKFSNLDFVSYKRRI